MIEKKYGIKDFKVQLNHYLTDLITSLQLPEMRSSKVGVSLFFKVIRGRTRENVLKFHKEVLDLIFRKKIFTERVVMHQNRLVREGIESPSLEVLKKHVEMALRSAVCDY